MTTISLVSAQKPGTMNANVSVKRDGMHDTKHVANGVMNGACSVEHGSITSATLGRLKYAVGIKGTTGACPQAQCYGSGIHTNHGTTGLPTVSNHDAATPLEWVVAVWGMYAHTATATL